MSMQSNLEKLDAIHPENLDLFFATGDSNKIPDDIKQFLYQLQWAAEIYEYDRNISRAATKLRTRIAAKQKQRLSPRTCMARVYEAINYFNVDSNVPIEVWENNYANKYEDLAKFAIARNDTKTAKQCYDQAAECRRNAAKVAEADSNLGITFIITPDLTPEDLGFQKKSIKEIARKHNDGFYHKLIDSLPINFGEKKRLLRDADIEDAQILELNEE